jgi:hypothetical protein
MNLDVSVGDPLDNVIELRRVGRGPGALPARTRFRILSRDGYQCQYCGGTGMLRPLHVDHVIPRASGGSDSDWNLVVACEACNLGKSASDVTEAVSKHIEILDLHGRGLAGEEAEATLFRLGLRFGFPRLEWACRTCLEIHIYWKWVQFETVIEDILERGWPRRDEP